MAELCNSTVVMEKFEENGPPDLRQLLEYTMSSIRHQLMSCFYCQMRQRESGFFQTVINHSVSMNEGKLGGWTESLPGNNETVVH